uniref:Putative acyl-coa synthetase n=1 Tax=Lutzomyia longipalpis TaxID=7200 RepID=A0A7G3AB14_LUTLO
MFTTKYDSSRKVWSGRHLAPFHHAGVSLGRAICYTLTYDRRKVAQISHDTGIRTTNGELCDQMLTIASNLTTKGASRNKVIAIVAKNGPLIAPTVFAAFYLAIPVNTLDPNYEKAEITHMFRQTEPGIVFCDHDNYTTVKSAVNEISSKAKIINFGPRISGVENIEDYLVKTGFENSLDSPDVDEKTCGLILCSSGTTGLSKGVNLTHQHMLYLSGIPCFVEHPENGLMLCFSTLYWLSGIMHLLLTTFCGMTRIITTQTFSPELFLSMVAQYKVTHMISAPVHLSSVLECTSLTPTSLVSLREYMVGGSVVPEEKWMRAQDYLPNGFVRIVYGMSEVGFTTRQDYRTQKYCVGKLAPDLQLKIVNSNNQNLGPGESGELCFKPRYRFLGYIANAKATDEMIDDEGFVHSGDIGYMDNDGDLHIGDRLKDILKYCNHHVSPSEIENVICRIEEVEYAAVVGIPDPVVTDLPAALVVLREGANVTANDITQLVAATLSDAKQLRGGVYFVEKLPLTASGKVIKRKVRKKAIDIYRARQQGRAICYTLTYDRRKVAQISHDTGTRTTNGELCDQMLTIASNLITKGASRDKVIAIVAKNGPLIAPTVFAAFYLAIPVNTLDPNYEKAEITHMFRQTEPGIVFCDHDNYTTVKSAVNEISSKAKIINFGPRISGVENIEDYLVKTGFENSLDSPDVDEKTCGLILCSSGTTGLSKGVNLTHQHMLYLSGIPCFVEHPENGLMLCFSSLYWLSGIMHLLLTTFCGMTRIITTQTFSPELFLSMVAQYKVTHMISAPVHLSSVLECTSLTPTSLVSLREYMVGGSVVPEEKWMRAQDYLPNGFVRIVYGMSEVGFTTRQDYRTQKYCVGKLAPDLQLKIVNSNNQNLGPGESGELCFKPRYRFLGYIANAKATDEMIDDEGFVHSGDIGYMDNDGDLHIGDRLKDILKYCNHHVSPSEIENVICRIEEVEYAAVVGIPDPVVTDLPAALVVLREGANVTANDITQLVAATLSDAKQLRGGVYFVEKLPLTASGKVIKRKVREKAIELYRARHQ